MTSKKCYKIYKGLYVLINLFLCIIFFTCIIILILDYGTQVNISNNLYITVFSCLIMLVAVFTLYLLLVKELCVRKYPDENIIRRMNALEYQVSATHIIILEIVGVIFGMKQIVGLSFGYMIIGILPKFVDIVQDTIRRLKEDKN